MEPLSKHRESIVEKVLEMLEEGIAHKSFVSPWRSLDAAHNLTTGKPYRGTNSLVLALEVYAHGYSDSRWCTYKQAQAVGAYVKKGSKGTRLCFYRPLGPKDEPDEKDRPRFALRRFTVFHASQIEGLPTDQQLPALREPMPQQASRFVESLAIERRDDCEMACYVPSRDVIDMPPRERFVSMGAYLTTLFHEIGHATGHDSRCGRDLSGSMGSPEYAFEELVAEWTGVRLGARFALPDEREFEAQNCACYLRGWLSLLEQRPQALFEALALSDEAIVWCERQQETTDQSYKSP